MASRKGVFVGAYVPNHLKESLRRRVAAEHRTLSQEITCILEEAVHGKGLPPGSIDRRNRESTPRRRTTDPIPGRRSCEVAFDNLDNRMPQDSAARPARKLKQNWAGGLSDYSSQYTSLDLQKKALEWRGD
jgi:hypothetical protein